jgi:hypothetical protein
MMFYLAEAEGLQTDAYRKMVTCVGKSYEKAKYFLPGLRNGIKSGQNHYLNFLGVALLFDDDIDNDSEGIEYLKLAISYGYPGHYELAQYYNFVTQEIDKCEAIYELAPFDWKSDPSLFFVKNYAQQDEGFVEFGLILPYGCFENIARINGKKITITKTGDAFSARIQVKESDFGDPKKCYEFLNGRVKYHPDFSRGGSVIGTKHITNCHD